ncbi:hypothetical protein MKX73_14915 [Solibacillus sp. FSL W7-1436]|uniref:hypothetical protein n=1 Tax=Solibacillus sp. FSL W7-1436 TaxID=2921705 RepID=UPI0030F6A735
MHNWLVAYAVSGEAHDYVEETIIRLCHFAKQQFTYPFYLYFESYYDAIDEFLADTNIPIMYKPSGRTVPTQIGRKCFQAEVPAFTVEIRNENDLMKHLVSGSVTLSIIYFGQFGKLIQSRIGTVSLI